MNTLDYIKHLQDKINSLEDQLNITINNVNGLLSDKDYLIPDNTVKGFVTALVVDTIDPLKQNRIRFYTPLIHDKNTPKESLDWAYPISNFGGIDDSGATWVPPAGSTVCVMFENGNRESPYYLGTTWSRNRGPEGNPKWNYPVKEFNDIHDGNRRENDLFPSADGSAVFPPWHNENYNGYDVDSIKDFEEDPEAQRKATYSHIYGFKTPQKHMFKMDDGDYKCNFKNKRIELKSGNGNWLIFKDDHLHSPHSYIHPSCGGIGSENNCTDSNGNPIEKDSNCNGGTSGNILGGHPSTPDGTKYGLNSNTGSNPYFRNKDECRPYKGPQNEQNNKCELPQSGIQFLSISGHSIILDDSVEEPNGIPNYQRSHKEFDYGCNDKFLGRLSIKSAHGHLLQLNDEESEAGIRNEENGIKLLTQCGNRIQLSDHTINSEGVTCPPGKGGKNRGITLETTSTHILEMLDEDNEQCASLRKSGGVPEAKASKALIRIKTGYGSLIEMIDEGSQQETKEQYILIKSPQKDCKLGPHFIKMQENIEGGILQIHSGGNMFCTTKGSLLTQVGDYEESENSNGPKDRISIVTGNDITSTNKNSINIAQNGIQYIGAKSAILLGAGENCCSTNEETSDVTKQPCFYPVLCYTERGITISDKVFVSAGENAKTASIFDLVPFMKSGPVKSNC